MASGVVSYGDAAGLIDPISGEGLTTVLVGGKRSGAAVSSFLNGKPGALDDYSQWVRDWGQSCYAPTIEKPKSSPRPGGATLVRPIGWTGATRGSGISVRAGMQRGPPAL